MSICSVPLFGMTCIRAFTLLVSSFSFVTFVSISSGFFFFFYADIGVHLWSLGHGSTGASIEALLLGCTSFFFFLWQQFWIIIIFSFARETTARQCSHRIWLCF